MATLAEIRTYPKGAPIQDVRGQITQAYKTRSGDGQWGPWTVMDFEIEDAGGSMKGQWWQPMLDDPELVKGRVVTISAAENGRGDVTGASIAHDEYKGEKRIRIKVNGPHLQFDAPETAGAPGAAQAAEPYVPAGNGTLTLTQFFGVADRATRTFGQLGHAGDGLSSCVNTTLIALTNQRLAIDAEPIEPDDIPY